MGSLGTSLLIIALSSGQYDPTAKEADQERKLNQKVSLDTDLKGTLGHVLEELAKKLQCNFSVDFKAFEKSGHKNILEVRVVLSAEKNVSLREHLQNILKPVGGMCRAGKGYIEIVPSTKLPSTPINAIAFSRDGKLLAIAGSNLRLFDLSTGRELGRAAWTSHCRCRHLAFSPDGRRLVSAHEGGVIGEPDLYVYLWQIGAETKLRRVAELLARKREDNDYFTDLYHASFSPDNRTVVAGSAGETIYAWDCETAQERFRLRGGVAAAFAADGQTLLAMSHDGLVRKFEAASGKAIPPPKDFVQSDYIFTKGVAFASTGDRVAVWDNNQVLILDTKTGERICRLTFPGDTKRVTLSADGRYLIVAEFRGGIWLFDAATGRELGWRKSGKGEFGDAGIALAKDHKTLVWVEHDNHMELQTLGEVLAGCVKGPADVWSDPADVPLQAELIAKQDRFVVNLAKLTPEEFCNKLTRSLPDSDIKSRARRQVIVCPDIAFPSKPHVDLEFRVRNTGKEAFTFSPDLEPETFLAGPGALNIYYPCQTGVGSDIGDPPIKPVTLKAGEKYSFRVQDLMPFGFGSQCLWVLPGEYSIYASCRLSVTPAPKGTKADDDGSGSITLRSPPLKVKVVKEEK